MDSDFSLNKLGWFTVEMVEENAFLNDKLENDTYGIFYTVKFEGNAETYLWQAKTAPPVGAKVYGHLELTKSGKSTKFKRASKDQTPVEGQSPAPTAQAPVAAKGTNRPDTQGDAIARSVALKAAVDLISGSGDRVDKVLEIADMFLAWLQGSESAPASTPTTAAPEAKRDWSSVGKPKDDGMSTEEVSALVESIDDGVPFNLDEIPF